jgi:hypothetical protein
MKQQVHYLTLGVNELERSMQFFREAFDWKTKGIMGAEYENGAIVSFELRSGLMLLLYERKNLAWDSGLEQTPDSATEFSVGHLVNTDKEVDVIMEQARKSGAVIIKPAHNTFWGGYGGYFKDIDGHLWEIAHNPAFRVEE